MPTTMKLIAKNVLGSSASSVTFSDIPSTYTDLVFVISSRDDYTGGAYHSANIRPNGATTNRSSIILYGSGTTTASASFSTAYFWSATADATSSTFANTAIYFPNYAGSTNKSFSVDCVVESNAANGTLVLVGAGLWSNTAAISSMTFACDDSKSFVSGSSFFLFGITKA